MLSNWKSSPRKAVVRGGQPWQAKHVSIHPEAVRSCQIHMFAVLCTSQQHSTLTMWESLPNEDALFLHIFAAFGLRSIGVDEVNPSQCNGTNVHTSSSWGTFEIASYLFISGVRKQPSSSLVELPTQEDIKYLCLSKHIWTIHNTCTIVHICTYLKDSPCDKNKIVIACNCYINVINWYMMFRLYQK